MIREERSIARAVHPARVLLLTLDAPPVAAGWPGPLSALPALGGWLERAAQGSWPTGREQAEPWSEALSAFIKQCAGLEMGLLNLPGLWPPPSLAGWCLPRPPADAAQAQLSHPPELAFDSADLAAGLTWFASRRPIRPHQRDQRLSEVGACAWLVREHALRLALERPTAWLGVGFGGLAEAWELTHPQADNLFAMLLGQIEDHAVHLAQRQLPEITLLLTGAGWAIQGPGLVKPGRVDGQDPPGVLVLLARAAGLAAPFAPPPALAGLLVDQESRTDA